MSACIGCFWECFGFTLFVRSTFWDVVGSQILDVEGEDLLVFEAVLEQIVYSRNIDLFLDLQFVVVGEVERHRHVGLPHAALHVEHGQGVGGAFFVSNDILALVIEGVRLPVECYLFCRRTTFIDSVVACFDIWVMFFALPILSASYGTFNYLQNLEILTDGWYSLWTQHTLFYSMLFFPAMVATYAAYLWRLEHLGHNWNLIMASPVPPLDLFTAKFAVVAKLALLTHSFVFALFVFCGKVFAQLPGLPPVTLPLYLLRGLLGALAVIAAQLVLAMVIRSFAVPIFLGLLGGITGIFISSKGFGLLWPYSLMQLGMNSNKSADALAGSYAPFAFSCLFWLAAMFALAWLLLRRQDVHA